MTWWSLLMCWPKLSIIDPLQTKNWLTRLHVWVSYLITDHVIWLHWPWGYHTSPGTKYCILFLTCSPDLKSPSWLRTRYYLHCTVSSWQKKKKVFNFGLTAAVYLFLCSARLWGHECDRCCDQLCADWHVSTSQGLLLRVRDTAHIVDSGYWGNSYTHTNSKTSYVHDPYSIYLHSGSSLVVYTQHLCCILSVVLYCNCYGVS